MKKRVRLYNYSVLLQLSHPIAVMDIICTMSCNVSLLAVTCDEESDGSVPASMEARVRELEEELAMERTRGIATYVASTYTHTPVSEIMASQVVLLMCLL